MLNAADPTICVRAVEPRSAGDVCRVIQGEARLGCRGSGKGLSSAPARSSARQDTVRA